MQEKPVVCLNYLHNFIHLKIVSLHDRKSNNNPGRKNGAGGRFKDRTNMRNKVQIFDVHMAEWWYLAVLMKFSDTDWRRNCEMSWRSLMELCDILCPVNLWCLVHAADSRLNFFTSYIWMLCWITSYDQPVWCFPKQKLFWRILVVHCTSAHLPRLLQLKILKGLVYLKN